MKVVYYLKFENDERNFNDFFKMDSHAKRNISKISTALSPGCYFLLDANDRAGWLVVIHDLSKCYYVIYVISIVIECRGCDNHL